MQENSYIDLKAKLSMNFDKISVNLKKISRIVETLKDADIEVSNIEQELVLSYIRELHDAVTEGRSDAPANPLAAKSSPTPPESFQEPKKVDSEPEPNPVKPEIPTVAESVHKQELPVEREERIFPKAPEQPAVRMEEQARVESSNGSHSQVGNGIHFHEKEAAHTHQEVEERMPELEERVPELSPELVALFEVKAGNELSDRLSMSPIRDLRKSMGVNERIFTINELFDGNQNLFDEVVNHLNSLDNFAVAADYLKRGVALANNWEAAERQKKAEHFIRLVYRRYL